ncbi:MAG TPA: hypothetical protein PLX35_09165 [Cyclobacteriaceae bacterium]|nr:hypothetical protein [Cyclobacteriaceae bacterium]
MEYSYLFNHQHIRIQLNDDTLTLLQGDQLVTIPYGQLSQVNLSRLGCLYQVRLKARGQSPVTISNDGMDDDGAGRNFALFIRVLHHYLHQRSEVQFRCSPDCRLLILAIFVISQSALAILWIGPLANWGWADRLWLSLAVLALAGILGLVLPKFLSRAYSPLNIPLHYLP